MDANKTFNVMVWVRLTDEKNDYLRVVKPYNKAILMTQAANALGHRAGIQHEQNGTPLSTPAQIRRAYAILRADGYTLQA